MWLIKKESKGIIPIVYLCGSAFITVFPFVCYFVIEGNLIPFINEYFLSTTETIYNPNTSFVVKYLSSLIGRMVGRHYPYEILLVVISLFGSIFFTNKVNHGKGCFLVIWNILMFAGYILHPQRYAFVIYTITFIYTLIWLVLHFKIFDRKIVLCLSMFLALSWTVSANLLQISTRPLKSVNSEEKEVFMDIANIMREVEKPTLINACCFEYGYGVFSEALPGSKYWALQNGATKKMLEEHRSAILDGKSDFIYINELSSLKKIEVTIQDIIDVGYEICYQRGPSNQILLSSSSLKLSSNNSNQ